MRKRSHTLKLIHVPCSLRSFAAEPLYRTKVIANEGTRRIAERLITEYAMYIKDQPVRYAVAEHMDLPDTAEALLRD